MNSTNFCFFLIFILCQNSCIFKNEASEECYDLSGTSSRVEESNYFESLQVDSLVQVDADKEQVFGFRNNPFNLHSGHKLIVFLNNNCIYKGPFKRSIEVNLNALLEEGVRAHFHFKVAETDEDTGIEKYYTFNTKSTMSWRKKYIFIQTVFMPTNSDPNERVVFFPTSYYQ